MRVVRCTPRSRVYPMIFQALQFVSEVNLLRFNEGRRTLLDFKIPYAGCNLHRRNERNGLTIQQTRFNYERGRLRIISDRGGVDHGNAILRGKPQLAIARSDAGGPPPPLHSTSSMPSIAPNATDVIFLIAPAAN